jgi:hypothetical protein
VLVLVVLQASVLLSLLHHLFLLLALLLWLSWLTFLLRCQNRAGIRRMSLGLNLLLWHPTDPSLTAPLLLCLLLLLLWAVHCLSHPAGCPVLPQFHLPCCCCRVLLVQLLPLLLQPTALLCCFCQHPVQPQGMLHGNKNST